MLNVYTEGCLLNTIINYLVIVNTKFIDYRAGNKKTNTIKIFLLQEV